MKEEKKSFTNPIDKDKVTENPSSLPYAHTVGGALVKPIDKGRVKGLAVSAMYEQTEEQLNQIKRQIELLAIEAQDIHRRIELSEKIYLADIGFKPIIGKRYFLYENGIESWTLSMISPEEWRSKCPYDFSAEVQLMSDHTWKIIRSK